MQMPLRKYSSGNSSYRYGFSGKELDKETSSTTTYDYGFRIYSPALGRFLSVDPLASEYAWNSTYSYAEGDPINYEDIDGLERPSVRPVARPARAAPKVSVPIDKEVLSGRSGGSRAPVSPSNPPEVGPYQGAYEAPGGWYVETPNGGYFVPNENPFGPQPEMPKPDFRTPQQKQFDASVQQAEVQFYYFKRDINLDKPTPLKIPKFTSLPSVSPTNVDVNSKSENSTPKVFYVTYTKTKLNSDGTITTYSGRSSGTYSGSAPTEQEKQAAVDSREASHTILNGEGYGRARLDKASTNKAAIRGREQQLIDNNGGAQSEGGHSRNKIRGVGRSNPNAPVYKAAATAEFGTLQNNNPADNKPPGTP